MQRITASGGLAFGRQIAPAVDIIPTNPSHAIRLDDVERVLATELGIWKSDRHIPTIHGPYAGLIGIYQSGFALRLLCAKGQSASDAMIAVDQQEGGLPPAIAAAVYAASEAAADEHLAAVAVVAMAWAVTKDKNTAPSQLTAAGRQQAATTFLRNGSLPRSALDRAAVIAIASKNLWRSGASQIKFNTADHAIMLGRLAGMRFGLRPELSVLNVGDTQIVAPRSHEAILAWPQYLEWDAGRIPAPALRYLHNGRWPAGQPTLDRRADQPTSSLAVIQRNQAQPVVAALLADAERNAVYAVTGAFTLELPNDYPLRSWSISALRVYADANGLWIATIDTDGSVGVSFQWQPHRPIRPFCVDPRAEPLLQITLAALWRDLQVAGDAAIPHAGRSTNAPTSQRPTAPPASHRRITLPRRQAQHINGHRQWGSTADRESIRRAHHVCGHLRRLTSAKEASDDSQARAQRHGIILPAGFTFVRPHTRGQGHIEQRETIVVARGLSTAVAAVKSR